MSTLKRLANLARGGFLVLQRGPGERPPLTAEDLAPRRRPPPRDEDEEGADGGPDAPQQGGEPGVRTEVPVTPRKRRL